MSSRRNDQNLTPKAARTLARSFRFWNNYDADKRIREQLVAAGLVVATQHSSREWSYRLTENGLATRKVYRKAGVHHLTDAEKPHMTADEKREWAEALTNIAGAVVAVTSF